MLQGAPISPGLFASASKKNSSSSQFFFDCQIFSDLVRSSLDSVRMFAAEALNCGLLYTYHALQCPMEALHGS